MYGLNIDPRNPQGNPAPARLKELGVEVVRYTFKDGTVGREPDPEAVRFYRREIERLSRAGVASLIILTPETIGNRVPAVSATEEAWVTFQQNFAERASAIAKSLIRWRPAFQIWQAPDQPPTDTDRMTDLSALRFSQLLQRTSRAIKQVDADLLVVSGGLVSGQPDWLAAVKRLLGGQLPVDAVGLHPYTQRPSPAWPATEWGSGYIGDFIRAYQAVTDLPLWLTEIGVDSLDRKGQGEYLSRLYNSISREFGTEVDEIFWFSYSDGMAYPFGLVDHRGQPKPAYQAYKAAASTTLSVATTASTAATVSRDRLHLFARYLEQYVAFGDRDHTTHQQMEAELRNNDQRLSRADIWYIMNRMLSGSPFTIEQPEIVGLDALQAGKDLYGMLRSIVMATHTKTGVLTGRVGPHLRVAAESGTNAVTNIEAAMRVVARILPGNRLLLMDTVKATADETKLQAPDVFETNIFGQHRNGLLDNHAWNLQRLARTIRDRGRQDRVMLIMRLDGPDSGANVDIFNGSSVQKYELAIAKFIRYLETVLPDVPFKLVLGNEPDLFEERPWSDPQIDPRTFAIGHFAPAMGAFMKRLALARPDVTFVAPALSKNLKDDQLAYYTAFFGQVRPDNLIPALHGYGDYISTVVNGQRPIEGQINALRNQGNFHYIAGTELGSNNPFGDGEFLSDDARLSDVVLWLLLSVYHQATPGQDNQWSFRINPDNPDDPHAIQLSHVANRSEQRILRNIRERGGGEIQLVRNHIGQRPAYAVEYLSHNTPATMGPGDTRTVLISLRNASYRTWPAGGSNPVRLGYHWFTQAGQAVPAEQWADFRTPLPRDLLPGEAITLSAKVGAPRPAGSYEVRWDMVEEGITWFGWQGIPTLDVAVAVGDGTPPPPSLSVRSSHNNVQSGADNLRQAIDNNLATRWSSRTPQQPGMWFEIDLGQVQPVSGLTLDSANSPQDYPRGYIVRLSTDRSQWVEVARAAQNEAPLDVTFSLQQARYLRVEQTGRSDRWWWSIHEVRVREEPGLSVRSSHNNVQSGADNLRQAIDNNLATRWSSRAPQQPGMWFEIDLGQVQPVSGLTLDSANSPQDYPRGYIVRLSTDRNQWDEVARAAQNETPLDVTFSPQQARYLRVEQTGSSDRWWWSIHEVRVT